MTRRLHVSVCLLFFALPLLAATAPSASATKPEKPIRIARGATVNLADYVVPGKTTIFDFFSDYCGPCVQFAPELERLHRNRDNIVVVIVDINRPGVKGIDWHSPVATQYKLQSIPHLKVFGPNGKLMAEDGENSDKARRLVMGWISQRG